MKNLNKSFVAILSIVSFLSSTMSLAGADEDVAYMQNRWAEVNYQLDGKAQLSAFDQLVAEAEKFTAANPDSAPVWIWSGIIKSSYAGAKGGLGALGLAKESKAELEKAIDLDGSALDGSAYTSLGTLYAKVPGWPVGFGDDDKAEELLVMALSLNPDGIDPNYFYADYLVGEKKYVQAREYLDKAAKASPRPGREVADAGRRQEIADLQASIEGK